MLSRQNRSAKWTYCFEVLDPREPKISLAFRSDAEAKTWKTSKKILAYAERPPITEQGNLAKPAARSVRKRTPSGPISASAPTRENDHATHGPAATSIALWFTCSALHSLSSRFARNCVSFAKYLKNVVQDLPESKTFRSMTRLTRYCNVPLLNLQTRK